MEEFPKIKQAFNLLVWLQLNTKLKTHFNFDGTCDLITFEVYNGDESLIDFKIEAVLKKSQDRIKREAELLVVQLLELKSDEYYQI
jgi:hypothetical protein